MDNGKLIAGWETKTLDELCNIARGGSPRPIKQFLTDADDGVNWIKIGDATASIKYIYETKEKIKPEGIQRSRLVKEGDFILSNSMSFGRPYIMKTTGCIHDGWLVLSDKSGLFTQDFLYYFLGSDVAYKQFDELAAGSTVRNLNIGLVKNVKVLLPPLPEQKRIVAILDEAFAGISLAVANAEKNLANARELFESHTKLIIDNGELIGRWKKNKLAVHTKSVSTGPFGSLLHKSDYVSKGTPLINPINIVNGKIVPDTSKLIDNSTKERLNKYILNLGDIVIGRRGEIGRCAVVEEEQAGWICGTGCFFIRPLSSVKAEFLTFLLRSQTYKEKLENVSTGATMKNISNKSLANLIIGIPSVKEQENILNEIYILECQVQNLEAIYQQKLTALNELKQSILQKAFAGQLTMDK